MKSTLYYDESQQPLLADGLRSDRYINFYLDQVLVDGISPSLTSAVSEMFNTIDHGEAILVFKCTRFKDSNMRFVIAFKNAENCAAKISVGRNFIIDTMELGHGGIRNHVYHVNDIEAPFPWRNCCYSRQEVCDIFAGPHSCNYPLGKSGLFDKT